MDETCTKFEIWTNYLSKHDKTFFALKNYNIHCGPSIYVSVRWAMDSYFEGTIDMELCPQRMGPIFENTANIKDQNEKYSESSN